MNVRLHIEHLVLDGLPVDAADAPMVQAALEAELTRLITERGVGSGLRLGGALAHVRGGPIRVAAGDTPAALGDKIGRSVHGGLLS